MNRQSKTKRGILVAIILACLIALIGGTYARYSSSGTVNATVQLAKWKVKLNNTDISSQSANLAATLVFDNNLYVANDRIAPGRTAHFDVELDPDGSEVAIDYILNVDTETIKTQLLENSTSKLAVVGATYKVGSGEAQVANLSTSNTISFTEPLANVLAKDKVVLTVTIGWDNDSDNQNASDTKEGVASYNAGTNGKVVTVPVTATAQQHV